jgi:broad specificity phosphatase PhoE
VHLILVRHAEKSLEASPNPSLSSHGFAQARHAAKFLLDSRWPAPEILCASPKFRAQQTLEPLAKHLGLDLHVLPSLDERRHEESFPMFTERLKKSIEEIEAKAASTNCLVLCSHLDWIEEFRNQLSCEEDLAAHPYDHWSSGQFMVLKKETLWKVVTFGRMI